MAKSKQNNVLLFLGIVIVLAALPCIACADSQTLCASGTFVGEFDNIIVGLGTAGSIVTGRLATQTSRRVLGIGVGGYVYNSPQSIMPLTNMTAAAEFPGDYAFWTVSQWSYEGPGNGRVSQPIIIPWVLGGGSMVNGGVFQFPAAQNYNEMCARGLTNWCLPRMVNLYTTKIENYQPFNSTIIPPGRGTTGAIQTRAIPPEFFLNQAMLNMQTATETQFVQNMGVNGNINGTGIFTRPLGLNTTTGEYYRQDTFTFNLLPQINMRRRNLEIITNAQVTDISRTGLLCKSKRGDSYCYNTVHFVKQGRSYFARVKFGGEITISAGAINTPKILFRSGVGDCNKLKQKSADFVCRVNSTSIGNRIYDHLANAQTYIAYAESPDYLPKLGSIVGSYYSANRTDGEINIESALASFPVPLPNLVPGGPVINAQFILIMHALTNPESYGQMNLRDDEWSSPLNVTFGVFDNPADLPPLITAFRKARQAMLQTPGFNVYVFEASPGLAAVPIDATDAQIATWIIGSASQLNTFEHYHTTNTVPIGHCNQGAAVDNNLMLCGASGVSVADNSIMRKLYNHATDASARLIGENKARMILGV